MILWLAALVLIGFPTVVGYRAGAVRAALSLVGLLLGAVLAMPLSPLLKPVVKLAGVHNPLLLPVLPPLIVFLLILIIFKVIAQTVHYKVELYYEYKTNDTIRAKWERLSARLGLCVGVINGAIYFFLVMIPIYIGGYLTTQVAEGSEAPKSVKILNAAREQIHTSKIDGFVAAHDPAPEAFYDASDILGLVMHNPLLVSRLSRYPDFLSLAERPEFQAVSTDADINNLIQSQASIGELLKQPKVQAIVTNSEITADVTRIIGSDLKDLKEFLNTGKSPKYDSQKILGRWTWDRPGTIAAEKKKKGGYLTPQDLQRLNGRLAGFYGAQLVAMPDNQVLLKHEVTAQGQEPKIAEGTWKDEAGGYQLTLSSKGPSVTTDVSFADDTRLSFNFDGLTFFFDKEQ